MIANFEVLTNRISNTSRIFLDKVRRQVNSAYTMRNWLIGHYIVEYEQHGEDRAAYGDRLLEKLAGNLKENGAVGMSSTNLRLFRQFYVLYPQIHQTVSDELKVIGLQGVAIDRSMLHYSQERGGLFSEGVIGEAFFFTFY